MQEKELTPEERTQEVADKLKVIVEANDAGQIKIYKVARYQGAPAAPGITIYRIKYISDNVAVYDGAYFMEKDFEAAMIDKNQNITNFILFQLATQL